MAINSTISVLEPLLSPWVSTITVIANYTKILVGGLFGYYIIIFTYKIIRDKKWKKEQLEMKNNILDMKKEVEKLNKKINKLINLQSKDNN